MKKSIFTLLTIALLFCNKYADSILQFRNLLLENSL